MGWNEPNKGKDPWNSSNQPPDLDEIFKKIVKKFRALFSSKTAVPKVPDSESWKLPVILFSAIVILLWALSGIFIVDPAEQAVILRFGKYLETVGPGPHWIPRFIESKNVINVERVLDYSYSGQMLTRDENLVSVSLVVQYKIGDLQNYLFNVANPEESLQQATSSALRQVVGRTTLDQIITEGREVWGNSVQENLIKTLDLYKTGISIVNVSPQPARAPENVQEAFDDAIKAQEDEKRFKEQAYAYAAKVVPIAEGNASRIRQEAEAFSKQVVLKAQGEVAEFLAVLPQYRSDPQITAERLYLDMMQKVLNNSSKIIVDNKSNNLLYLPLEQLLKNEHSNLNFNQLKVKSSQNTDNASEPTVGRNYTRPIYGQGSF